MAKKKSTKTTKKRSGASGSSRSGSKSTKKKASSFTDEQDRKLVTAALKKKGSGENLTQREEQALKRFQKKQDEAQRERLYESMPKGDYARLSGRTHRVLQDQAKRYGLPLEGRTIDLGALLKRFHDLIAENRGRFAVPGDDDPMFSGPPNDAKERYQLAQARMAEHKLEQLKGRLVDRDEMLRALTPLFERIRLVGETLQREFGPGAHQLLDDALSESEDDLENLFGDIGSSTTPEQAADKHGAPADAGSDRAGKGSARPDDA